MTLEQLHRRLESALEGYRSTAGAPPGSPLDTVAVEFNYLEITALLEQLSCPTRNK